jgi:pyruvate/2-oxoglutarate dehydrogenase complex dihydrolipoamide dehydrogenase (E3) component
MEIPDGLFGQASRGTAVIVGDPATGEILGAQAVGPVAPAFVPAVALARQFEYCLDDLAGLIPAEPYLSAPLATAARAWLRASNRPV